MTVRVYGEPMDNQIEELSLAVARGLRRAMAQAPLQARQAGYDLSAISGVLPTVAEPSFSIRGEPILVELIQRAVHQGIQRGISGEALSALGPQIILAQAPRSQLFVTPGQEREFWRLARQQLLMGLDPAERARMDPDLLDRTRSGAIELLFSLIDRTESQAILREGLDIPVPRSSVRISILNALARVAGNRDIIWDLILYGVGQQNDTLVESKFEDWFRRAGGRHIVAFLDRKLAGTDADLRNKAAKVVLHLLELQYTPEARQLADNLHRLRQLAARHNLWTGGELGVESFRQLVRSQINILLNLLVGSSTQGTFASLDWAIRHSLLVDDPHKDEDLSAIDNFQRALRARLDTISRLDLIALEELDTRLSQTIQAAIEIRSRIGILHNNVSLLREFLGSLTVQSDEIITLFRLRHDYIRVLTNALTDAEFRTSMREMDMAYTRFDETVANVKWQRIRRQFGEIRQTLIQARDIQPGAGPVSDQTFFAIRDQLDDDERYLSDQFHPPTPTLTSGMPVVVTVGGRPVQAGPGSLAHAVNIENDVNLFGLRTAMFALYALALRLHNDLVEHSIGSEGFRDEQGRILRDIRAEIARYYQNNQFRQFSDRAEQLKNRIEQVARDIRQRARLDVAVELLITAAAALLTAGVGAIARFALIGRTLAIVRTAEAASTVVFLAEAGTFTAAQLAGERLAFGRPVTLGGAAEAFAGNIVFFGAFRVLGELTRPLARGRTLLAFISPHLINIGALTGVSALITRAQTGEWPHDIGLFLLNSVGSYIIIAGINAGVRRVAEPRLIARAEAMATALDQEVARLRNRVQHAIETRTLTEEGFEDMRRQQLDLHNRAREFMRFLYNEGLINDEVHEAFEEYVQFRDNRLNSVRFTAPPALLTGRAGARVLRALPAPASVRGLVRLGTSNIYRYNPSQPPEDLPALLAPYEGSGYGIQRYLGGVVQVTAPTGETLFVIEPGPIVPALLPPLPALSPGAVSTPPPITLVQRVTGVLPTTELEAINTALNRINPRLVRTLEGEFQEPTAMAALSLLIEQRGMLQTRWSINAVRGLATMLQLERGITAATVRRLFHGLNSDQLNNLFAKYLQIAETPGANFLVDEEIAPSSSDRLIDAYDAIRQARLQLPDNMSRLAIFGLLRWIREGRNVPEELGRIPPDRRLARLEADSPRRDPRQRPVSRVEALLRQHAQDIRPGLNLLHGSSSETVQSIETWAQNHNGSFSEVEIRNTFQRMVESYRGLLTDLQSGRDVERNVVGAREEIEAVVRALESGAQVFSVGPVARVRIDPDFFPLPRNYSLINAPRDIPVQIDTGARRIDGRLVIEETTTGELSLPQPARGLDPQSGEPAGGTINWNDFNPDDASHRKFTQMIKMRAAAIFATELGRAFGNANVEVPELVIRVSRITAPARRAAEALGFRVITAGD